MDHCVVRVCYCYVVMYGVVMVFDHYVFVHAFVCDVALLVVMMLQYETLLGCVDVSLLL